MAIDLTNQEALRKLTLEDLVADAVEKQDIDALRFLEDEASQTDKRTNKKTGVEYEVPRSIVSIRAKYLRDYCGYTPKRPDASKSKEKKKAERAEKRANLFEQAFKDIKKAKKK